MLENSNLLIIFTLLMIGYFVLYMTGRKYLEHFQSMAEPSIRFDNDGKPMNNFNTTLKPPEMPYLTAPIDALDAYEVSAVYQNQGSKEATKKQINDAMTRYPIDWSNQGPNSQFFQENQTRYNNAPKEFSEDQYRHIDASNRAIPDKDSMEDEEKKILQTYQPKSSKGLLQYSVQDVKHLLHKVYDKKGLIPVINKSEQGENIWEITEVKEKNPKIVWENDMNSTRNTMIDRGEEVIQVPIATSDVAAGLDPFFQPRDKVSQNKYDYTQWTPGMERMFAPTYPVKSWF